MENKKEYRAPEMKEILLKPQESLLQISYGDCVPKPCYRRKVG